MPRRHIAVAGVGITSREPIPEAKEVEDVKDAGAGGLVAIGVALGRSDHSIVIVHGARRCREFHSVHRVVASVQLCRFNRSTKHAIDPVIHPQPGRRANVPNAHVVPPLRLIRLQNCAPIARQYVPVFVEDDEPPSAVLSALSFTQGNVGSGLVAGRWNRFATIPHADAQGEIVWRLVRSVRACAPERPNYAVESKHLVVGIDGIVRDGHVG